MKKTNIIYWISTALLCLVMGGGAITNVMNTPQVATILEGHLHYPHYFATFIGIAKILGSIAILVPGFPKLKEWAYAGFAFDLLGATYSAIAVGDPIVNIAPMVIFVILFVVSYIYHRKRLAADQTNN